ncbi:MAG: hypothetical protein WBD71_07885 [Xanthobacteraceae bacterium]
MLSLLAESTEFDDAAGAAGVACAGVGAAIAGAALTGAALTGWSPTEIAGSAKAAEAQKSRATAVEANNRSARIPDITLFSFAAAWAGKRIRIGMKRPQLWHEPRNLPRRGGTLREPCNFVL